MEQRKYIDCSEQPGSSCSIKISGKEKEVVRAAVAHAIADHGAKDEPSLWDSIKKSMKPEKILRSEASEKRAIDDYNAIM